MTVQRLLTPAPADREPDPLPPVRFGRFAAVILTAALLVCVGLVAFGAMIGAAFS